MKEYQVDLDPNKLAAYDIPLSDVVAKIRRSNSDVGGKTFEVSSTEYFVRGRGYVMMFNATFDVTENHWKALSNYEMLQVRKFAENVYYHEFARDLRQLGYEIENKPRVDFQIKGVSPELRSRFSKRHNEIDASIERLLKEKPELAKGNLKELRSQIAQAERSRKISGIALLELQRLWNSQLTDAEKQSLRILAHQSQSAIQPLSVTAQAAVQWARV